MKRDKLYVPGTVRPQFWEKEAPEGSKPDLRKEGTEQRSIKFRGNQANPDQVHECWED